MKKAIVLVNLGTPSAATPAAVRQFLKPFLSDPRVVEIPRPLWWLILNLFILPFRPRKVAKAYESIFVDGQSPLRLYSEALRDELQRSLDGQCDGESDCTVALAMSYGEPGIADVSRGLIEDGCEQIFYLPLFPQYSATTTAACLDQIGEFFRGQRNICQWSWLKDYHDEGLYISALADSVRQHWQRHDRGDHLLMSFHGIPKRNIELGDPYYLQCQRTATLLAADLQLEEGDWSVSFQSRLGRAEWLQPYSIEKVAELAKLGVRNLDVIAPAFSTDCLETLEEIREELGERFLETGGSELRYIPCLNAGQAHVDLLAHLCGPFLRN